jgi:hypothetical protein
MQTGHNAIVFVSLFNDQNSQEVSPNLHLGCLRGVSDRELLEIPLEVVYLRPELAILAELMGQMSQVPLLSEDRLDMILGVFFELVNAVSYSLETIATHLIVPVVTRILRVLIPSHDEEIKPLSLPPLFRITLEGEVAYLLE